MHHTEVGLNRQGSITHIKKHPGTETIGIRGITKISTMGKYWFESAKSGHGRGYIAISGDARDANKPPIPKPSFGMKPVEPSQADYC